MTNAMIIFNESQRLAEEGVIKYTGKEFEAVDADGNEIVVKETEELHTYSVWKDMGYQVRKGEHAVAKIMIWKYTVKKDKETDEEESQMFMKRANFFSQSQVDKAN